MTAKRSKFYGKAKVKLSASEIVGDGICGNHQFSIAIRNSSPMCE